MNPFNPEAGHTPAPFDPLEIELTRRTARLVWRAVPYFAFRFGERGQRFGLSDGGWLVTLASQPEPLRREHVDWLAGVLSCRAMPSWLLELQLRATARVGGHLGWSGTAAMRATARHLADRRREVLPDAAFTRAAQVFADVAVPSRLALGTGRLVASAEADVALGLSRSAAPVTDWLRQPAIFPRAWCVAVERASALARAALRPVPPTRRG